MSIVGSRTYLDDAPFVQQRWEQLLVTSATGGVAGATTRQGEVASGWDPGLEQWYIERLDGGSMPVGAGFNVAYVPEPGLAAGIESGLAFLSWLVRRRQSSDRSSA